MKEKPILFSGPMVMAILENRKTKTRRLSGLEDLNAYPGSLLGDSQGLGPLGYRGLKKSDLYLKPSARRDFQKNPGAYHWFLGENKDARELSPILIKCPYGGAGDRLWVKETWRILGWDEDGDWCIEYKDGSTRWFYSVQEVDEEAAVRYWEQCTDDCIKAKIPEDDAGYFSFSEANPCPTRWRPSIFMPRWASRITLEITGVQVERLQEISRADILAEGIKQTEPDGFYLAPLAGVPDYPWTNAAPAFASLWNSINDKSGYGWDSNPFVWVIEFKKVES